MASLQAQLGSVAAAFRHPDNVPISLTSVAAKWVVFAFYDDRVVSDCEIGVLHNVGHNQSQKCFQSVN